MADQKILLGNVRGEQGPAGPNMVSKNTQVSGFSNGQVLYVNGSVVGAKTLTAAGIGAAAASHSHSYAGAATPGGAADAAVKLQTPRRLTIGKTSRLFDGTADLRWSAEDIGTAGAEAVFGEMHLNAMSTKSFQATVYRMGNLVRLAVWMQALSGGFPPYQFTLGHLDGVPYPPTTISSVAFAADSIQQIGTMGMIPVQVTPGGVVQINPGREGFQYLHFELCYPFE